MCSYEAKIRLARNTAVLRSGPLAAGVQGEIRLCNGAWDAAVGRREIVPRADKKPRFRHDTREAVRRLLEGGMSQTAVAFELGLSKGTVCYHVRQLGVEGDARFRRRYDWAEIQRAHDSGMSM